MGTEQNESEISKRLSSSHFPSGNKPPELHIFVLWPKGQQHVVEFLATLRARFGKTAVFEVEWSERFATKNLQRLYGSTDPMEDRLSRIGFGRLTVAVVRDVRPKYRLDITPSTSLENTNVNVTDLKSKLRALTETSDFKYLVHSSNSAEEADRDIFLLLGESWSNRLKSGTWPSRKVTMKRDLTGSEGWKSSVELIQALNQTVQYVSLRPGVNEHNLRGGGGDFDLLTPNTSDLVAVANATPTRSDGLGNHYTTTVEGQPLMLDIRQVGDTDCDDRWQSAMLRTRRLSQGVYLPEEHHLLFYLIYHAFLHSGGATTGSRKGEIDVLAGRVLGGNIVSFITSKGGLTEPQISAWILEKFLRSQSFSAKPSETLGSKEDPLFRTLLNEGKDASTEYLNLRRKLGFQAEPKGSSDLGPVLDKFPNPDRTSP